jgi:hypothetical protein
MTQSFEERFDEKFCNSNPITEYNPPRYFLKHNASSIEIKSFIRQEKELSRKEEQERIIRIIDTSSKPLSDIKKYINQEDK